MPQFRWNSTQEEPPARWDLRRVGWQLCGGEKPGTASAGEVRLIDGIGLHRTARLALVASEPDPRQAVLLGISDTAERAKLLAAGCGAVLPGGVGLAELDIRARRLAALPDLLPRLRRAGPLTLDLIHRDGRVTDGGGRESWLALHPREFALIWRLAESGGSPVSRADLLRDVWRLAHEPETNSVQVHVSRLRAKLAARGLSGLVETGPGGAYRLAPAWP